MTEKIGSVLLVEETMPGECELCGSVAELRPCGPGGKNICVDCGRRDPENTARKMNRILKKMLVGTTLIVHPNGEIHKVES
jgi:hypothetical protein